METGDRAYNGAAGRDEPRPAAGAVDGGFPIPVAFGLIPGQVLAGALGVLDSVTWLAGAGPDRGAVERRPGWVGAEA